MDKSLFMMRILGFLRWWPLQLLCTKCEGVIQAVCKSTQANSEEASMHINRLVLLMGSKPVNAYLIHREAERIRTSEYDS